MGPYGGLHGDYVEKFPVDSANRISCIFECRNSTAANQAATPEACWVCGPLRSSFAARYRTGSCFSPMMSWAAVEELK